MSKKQTLFNAFCVRGCVATYDVERPPPPPPRGGKNPLGKGAYHVSQNTSHKPDCGVCYTFNDPKNSNAILSTNQPGNIFGLYLRLDIQQYEYMFGFSDAAGVKVSIPPWFPHTQNSY